MTSFNPGLALRLLAVVVLAYVLWSAGLPSEVLAVIVLLSAAMLLLRDKIYAKIDRQIEKRFSFSAKWPAWMRKALVLLAFVLFVFVVKQAVYFALALVGIDVQNAMTLAANATG